MIEFIYNNRPYKVQDGHLEKKLKKLGISKEDIQIIENPLIQSISEPSQLERRYFYHPDTPDVIHVCFQQIGANIPISTFFKNQIWNPETKTGIRYITEQYVSELYERPL